MKYTVVVQREAVADSESIREYLAEYDPQHAERWINQLDDTFAKLSEFPNRFPFAPESRRASFVIRQVLVGKYRLLFAVLGATVRVLRIRHCAQQPLDPKDLN